jgi:hypothetical protein
MPREIISEHGIVRPTNAAKEIPKKLLTDEAFKNCRTHGTAINRANVKQLKHTTTDQKNSIETTFDLSQLNLMSLPSHIAECSTRALKLGAIGEQLEAGCPIHAQLFAHGWDSTPA